MVSGSENNVIIYKAEENKSLKCKDRGKISQAATH
jgi:hypothetical protein